MHVEIIYYGHSAFAVTTDDGCTIFTDPFQKTFRYPELKELYADIVTISHLHQGHNNFNAFRNQPSVIIGPGERELGWIKIKGIYSFHDRISNNTKSGPNTIFCWKMRSFSFCHLGDQGDILPDHIYEAIGKVDFLFIPVGGKKVLDPQQAMTITQKIQPRFVIPMHFKSAYYDCEYPLDDFVNLQTDIIISPKKHTILFRREEILESTKTRTIKLLPPEEEITHGS
jgi:L-ascorbate metabolism protein UlaG (beta-lactamase superfamily)